MDLIDKDPIVEKTIILNLIKEKAIDFGACVTCACRFAGKKANEQDLEESSGSSSTVLGKRKAEEEESKPKQSKASEYFCIVCLNILKPGQIHNNVQDIIGNITEKGYSLDCKWRIIPNISIPANIALREKVMQEVLVENVSKAVNKSESSVRSIIQESYIYVKDSVNTLTKDTLSKQLPANFKLDTSTVGKVQSQTKIGDMELIIRFESSAIDNYDFDSCISHWDPQSMEHQRSLQKSEKKKQWMKKKRDNNSEEFNKILKDKESLLQIQSKCTLSSVIRIVEKINNRELAFAVYSAWFLNLTDKGEPAICQFQLRAQSIYIWGRYKKFSRDLPQSPWFIDSVRKGKSSVEEIIAEDVAIHFNAQDTAFHGSGREDIDVRMLGNGRPFIVVSNDPKNSNVDEKSLLTLAGKINASTGSNIDGDIEVSHLRTSNKEEHSSLQKDTENKKKHYTCVVWVKNSITKDQVENIFNSNKEFTLYQNTPLRVLHRRAPLIREKMIHSMECEYMNQHFFILHLCASSGTYIKEFVHGDMGRTVPNVMTLIGGNQEADILQLDVTKLDDN